MTDAEMQVYINKTLALPDDELVEAIKNAEADLKNGKRIIPAGPTTEQIEMFLRQCREEAFNRGL